MPAPVYGTRDQLGLYGIGPKALSLASTAQQDAALRMASRVGDGYLGKRFKLPLTAWEDDLASAVCKIAAWDLISTVIGFASDDPLGTNAKLRYDEAISWFQSVADDDITPVGIVDSSSSTAGVDESSTIAAASDESRGWDRW